MGGDGIKTVVAAASLLTTAAIGCPPALLAACEHQAASLKGIRSMHVVVEDLDETPPGLTVQAMKTDVELKLRMAGIKLDPEVLPVVYVHVTCIAVASRFACAIGFDFRRRVTSAENDWQGYATTWNTGGVLTCGSWCVANIRQSVKDYVDEFLNDYLSVNPRQPSQ